MTKITIFDSEQSKFIISSLYVVENCFTFVIRIKSGEFSGISSFSIFQEEINLLIKKLFLMHETLEGTCSFYDTESDAFVTIEMLKHGTLNITGQLGGSHQDHILKFKSIMDQTILLKLINFFKTHL